MRTHVDLFSGIGGFSLACQWAGVETIAFSEIDSYASRVLQRHWPNVRNYGDVRNFTSLSAWLLTAGVPCQPASVAGKRQGAADDRWLWPETLTVVENGSYEWLLFENPTGILSLNDGLEFERICAALEGQGYEVQPLIVPACSVGALHRRNRVWIVAHSTSERWRAGRSGRPDSGGAREREQSLPAMADAARERVNRCGSGGQGWWFESSNCGSDVADATGVRLQGERAQGQQVTGAHGIPFIFERRCGNIGEWATEPDVGRVANGIPARVDRLRTLGNSIVPQVAFQLIKRMIEAEEACR